MQTYTVLKTERTPMNSGPDGLHGYAAYRAYCNICRTIDARDVAESALAAAHDACSVANGNAAIALAAVYSCDAAIDDARDAYAAIAKEKGAA